MGNRSFLYLTGTDAGLIEQVAEANNRFPSLWAVVLADSRRAAPQGSQRLDTASDDTRIGNIVGDAATGIDRLQTLVAYLLTRPEVQAVKGLGAYLQGAVACLHEALQGQPDGQAQFSANIEELSWAARDPADFVERVLHYTEVLWPDLQKAMAADNFEDVTAMLGLVGEQSPPTHLESWAVTFGLGGLRHDYFQNADFKPPETSYADYDPEAEELNLGSGCYRFKANGRFGVRRYARRARSVCDAVWHQLWPAEDRWAADDAKDSAIWLADDHNRIGLGLVSDRSGLRLVLEPQLDTVWDFNASGIALVQKGGLYGHLRRDGRWVSEPRWPDAHPFVHGYAPVVDADGRFGFINEQGELCVPCRYDDVDDFNAEGYAPVAQDERWGLIDRHGQIVVPLQHAAFWRDDTLQGWLYETPTGIGLLHADGRPWLEPTWTSIDSLLGRRLLRVARDERFGVADDTGALRLPCLYDDVQLRFDGGLPPFLPSDTPPPAAGVHFKVQRGPHVMLIDEHGSVKLPEGFTVAGDLPDHAGTTPTNACWSPRYVGVSPDDQHLGVWDIELQRLIVPCAYQAIYFCRFDRLGAFGFLSMRLAPDTDTMRLGLLHADGREIAEPQFLGFDEPPSELFGRDTFLRIACSEVERHWGDGRPVPALRDEGKRRGKVLLHADGRIERR